MARGEVDVIVLAARQHCVFSTAQARQLGLSDATVRRRCISGQFVAVLPGVVRHIITVRESV